MRAQRGKMASIARGAGLTYSWLQKFADGRITNPTVRTLGKLIEYLDDTTRSQSATQLSELLNGKVLIDAETLSTFVDAVLAARNILRMVDDTALQFERQCGKSLIEHGLLRNEKPTH